MKRLSSFTPLRTSAPLVSRFAAPSDDLAAALDRSGRGPLEFVLVRRRRAPTATEATLTEDQPEQEQSVVANDVAWALKIKDYFARRSGGTEAGSDEATRATAGAALAGGDRITASPSGLTIETFTRSFRRADQSTLSEWDQARLESIAARALAISEKMLAPMLRAAGSQILENVDVDPNLDLASVTDEEAASAWAQELAREIRSRLRRGVAELGVRRDLT